MSNTPIDGSQTASGIEQPITNTTTLPRCDDCGEYVTRDYHRVFSDNDGLLHSYLHCTAKGADRGESR